MLSIAGIAMLFFVFVHNGLIPFYAKYCIADSVVNANGETEFVVTGKLFGFECQLYLRK